MLFPKKYDEKVRQHTLAKAEEPKAPAKNRRMMCVQMFWDAADPALKAVIARKVIIKRIRLPNTSEKGAQTSGPTTERHDRKWEKEKERSPNAKPKTFTEMPSVMTSRDG